MRVFNEAAEYIKWGLCMDDLQIIQKALRLYDQMNSSQGSNRIHDLVNLVENEIKKQSRVSNADKNDGYKLAKKRTLSVTVEYPSLGSKVRENVATSNEYPYIIIDVTGDRHVASADMLCSQYAIAGVKLDIQLLHRILPCNGMVTLTQKRSEDFLYAKRISLDCAGEVVNQRGETQLYNEPGCKYVDGDFIVCHCIDGRPDLSNKLVVNGEDFASYYELLE